MNLLDLRHDLIHAEDPSVAMRWHMFGSSNHDCQPTGAVIRNFVHRSKTEEEMTEDEKEDAMEDLQRENEDQKVLIDELMKANCGHSWRKASDTK